MGKGSDATSSTPNYVSRQYDVIPTVSEARLAEIKEKFPHFVDNKDVGGLRKEAFLRLPCFLEDWVVNNMLEDPRDAVMASLILNILCTTVPLTVYLWKHPSHMLGLFVIVFSLGMFLQRFILMMHYAEHRKLFRKPYHAVLKHLLPNFLCAFFGIPPGMYRLHHVVMHHIENNVFDEDLSSTEPYQRDNFGHFLVYYARYWTALLLLPAYAVKKGRYQMAATSLCGSVCWIGLMALGWQRAHIFTLYAGILPAVITGFALMFGNFSQHIFVHPSIATMPQNYKSIQFNAALSMQCMNHFDNQYAFNDGYHVTHHVNSRIHWTDMPVKFMDNLEEYAKHDAVVFENLGFFDVGLHVMLGWWDALAERYVHLTKTKRSKQQVIAALKLRLAPIKRTNQPAGGAVTKKDSDDADVKSE